MRAVGMAERALALLVARAKDRVAFGRPLSEQGVVRQLIAASPIELEQVLLRLGPGVRIVDGPDAVHRRDVARQELDRVPPYVG